MGIIQQQKTMGIYIGLPLMFLQFQVIIIKHLGILCASKNAHLVKHLIQFYAKSLHSLDKMLNSRIAHTILVHILIQTEQFTMELQ